MVKNSSFLNSKLNKIILFLLVDILSLISASLLAVWLRFDFGSVPELYFLNSYQYLIIDGFILVFIFSLFRLYTSVWKYASITELLNVFMACFLFETTTFTYKSFFDIKLPRSYFIIQFLVLFILVTGFRFSYRILRSIVTQIEEKSKSVNTMIIGAGSACRLIIDEINNNKADFNNIIRCIIDDDKQKKGTFIKGVPVVGDRNDIIKACNKYAINEIIIAIPSASKSKIALIYEEAQQSKCNIKIVPKLAKSMGENESILGTLRPISYEDFLGRDQIVVDNEEIENSLFNKVCLVTGGGGSIGSELCRQIAKANPRKLIIFDIYENNAYDIQQELIRNYPNLDLETIIGSVRDYDRLEKVFIEFHPEIVFHAAAHKHVPLMEVSPNEAIKNNCLGTLNTAKLSDIYKVKKFVLVSTDKAVRPTNIMGASKRICEMIIQTMDKKSKNTDYVAVRFGNVLGSNGSVIPLFLKQIESGGPVTVTDKEITRFFMTIPEAVSLILQASVYAKGGEIFVLDMGKPVKIYELAKQIIRYKGFEPGVDMEIKITGLRPGEKLYEERLMDEEGLKKTPNKLISIGQPIKFDEDKFLKDLDSLIKESYKNEGNIKDKVAKIVTTYTVDKREKK